MTDKIAITRADLIDGEICNVFSAYKASLFSRSMIMFYHQTLYRAGEYVTIPALENQVAYVEYIRITPNGYIEYSVSYWHNGERKNPIVPENELAPHKE